MYVWNEIVIENATTTLELISATIASIEKYYIPIFLCLSLLGNSLCVCVFLRTKLRYLSSSIYLTALAISDIGVLMMIIINYLAMYPDLNMINPEIWVEIYKIVTCLSCFFRYTSVWLMVAFTVERYVAVRWPLLRRSLCTTARA